MDKSKSKIIKIGAAVAGGILAATALYFICLYNFAFVPTYGRYTKERIVEKEIKFFMSEENYKTHLDDEAWIENQNCPLIEITSHDGLKLKAIVLESKNPAKANVLLMHGYHSGPTREFATIARYLNSIDYNVILPYQRAHGLSEGKFLTFGMRERFDCRNWMDKVNEMYGLDMPLFVGGISMGCATITMSSGFDLPANVRGFIADCGFTDPWQITYWEMRNNMKLPRGLSNILLASLNFMGTHFFDFPFNEYSTLTALSKCNKPFLFISGTDDHTVPVEMTMTNYLFYSARNAENARLVLFENGPHAVSYFVDRERYNSEIKAFLEKYGAK